MKAEIHSYPFEDLFEKTVFTEMAQLNRGQIWLIIFKKKSNMKVGFYSLKAFQHHACDMIKQKRENKKTLSHNTPDTAVDNRKHQGKIYIKSSLPPLSVRKY